MINRALILSALVLGITVSLGSTSDAQATPGTAPLGTCHASVSGGPASPLNFFFRNVTERQCQGRVVTYLEGQYPGAYIITDWYQYPGQ